MAIDQNDPIARATQALREDSSVQWPVVSTSVRSRIRNITAPSRSISVASPSGTLTHDADGSQVWLSSRVLRNALRRALTTHRVMPDRLDLSIEDRALQHVSVEVVATYGDDLRTIGAQARQQVNDTVLALLGPLPEWNAEENIRIHICDIRLE